MVLQRWQLRVLANTSDRTQTSCPAMQISPRACRYHLPRMLRQPCSPMPAIVLLCARRCSAASPSTAQQHRCCCTPRATRAAATIATQTWHCLCQPRHRLTVGKLQVEAALRCRPMGQLMLQRSQQQRQRMASLRCMRVWRGQQTQPMQVLVLVFIPHWLRAWRVRRQRCCHACPRACCTWPLREHMRHWRASRVQSAAWPPQPMLPTQVGSNVRHCGMLDVGNI